MEDAVVKSASNEQLEKQFLLTEYKEASGDFFKGIDIGINYMKSYLVLNGILLAAFGISNPISGDISPQARAIDATGAKVIFPMLSFFGICVSLLFWSIVPYYEKQLLGCGIRCREIEAKFGGKLYTRIVAINEDRSRFITTTRGVRIVCFVFIVMWSAVLLLTLKSFGWITLPIR